MVRLDCTVPRRHSDRYCRVMFPFLNWNIRHWFHVSWSPDFNGYASVLWVGPLWLEWGRPVRAG